MAELPTNVPRIWLRSFYGFTPEASGYIGWTEESSRDRMLGLISPGNLFMIYGTGTSATEKSERLRVLGFLQVDAEAIRDTNKASEEDLRRKIDNGWKDKWTFAMPVRRAWRVDEAVLLETIAPKTYRPEAGQAIAVWSPPLFPEEVQRAFKIKVREVSVFGEPALQESPPQNQQLGQFFQPSRAFPGSSGLRISNYEDGPTMLYVALFEGDSSALLGRAKAIHDKRSLVKVGVTNDIEGRERQLNAGFPPASVGKWAMKLQSQPFPDRKSAEAAEARFKTDALQRLVSLGGEFFLGHWTDAQLDFASIPGVARFEN